jgi:hypothetical protein
VVAVVLKFWVACFNRSSEVAGSAITPACLRGSALGSGIGLPASRPRRSFGWYSLGGSRIRSSTSALTASMNAFTGCLNTIGLPPASLIACTRRDIPLQRPDPPGFVQLLFPGLALSGQPGDFVLVVAASAAS